MAIPTGINTLCLFIACSPSFVVLLVPNGTYLVNVTTITYIIGLPPDSRIASVAPLERVTCDLS
jgi:hypothetical protein